PPVAQTPSCGAAHLQVRLSAPVAGLCAAGTPSAVTSHTAPTPDEWRWTCTGSNVTNVVNCRAFKPVEVIDGVCGTAHGTSRATAPAGGILCATGPAGPVAGVGPWTWLCGGQHGGANAHCIA